MPRWLLVGLLLLVLTVPLGAVIERPIPLAAVLKSEQLIFLAKVEKTDPERPAVILSVGDSLKGKVPFQRLPVLMKGNAEANKLKHPEALMKRLSVGRSLVVFATQRERTIRAFVFVEGSWFQMRGVQEADDQPFRWELLQGEPYLRRTFKGSTDELAQVIRDGLAGRKEPPAPDLREKPGFGPESDPPKGRLGPVNRALAVIPTFVIVGPLALLAALFPTLFGGLALLMKRWMVLLSAVCTLSTLAFAHAWFRGRLAGTFWDHPETLWLALTGITLLATLWAVRRYHHAQQAGQLDVYRLRRSDFLGLGVSVLAFGAAVAWAVSHHQSLLRFPWLESLIGVSVAGVGLGYAVTTARRPDRTPALSVETVMLGTLLIGCSNVLTLEAVRGLGGSRPAVQVTAESGRPVEVAWTFSPPDQGVFFSTPAVGNGRVFVAGSQDSGFSSVGAVFAVDALTGQQLWKFDNEGQLKAVYCSPCLAGDRVFIGEGFHQDRDCKMFCLDAATGRKVWEFATTSHTESTPCYHAGRLYFGAGDDGLYCLDAADTVAEGKRLLWQYAGRHVDANPTVADGRVFAGSGQGDLFRDTTVFCLNAADGKLLWEVPTAHSAWGSPTVSGAHVFFGCGNGNLLLSDPNPGGSVLCCRVRDGHRLWQYDAGESVMGQPAVDHRSVYIGTRTLKGGECVCLDRVTGQVVWKTPTPAGVLSSVQVPTRANGAPAGVYAATVSGQILALDPDTGAIVWSFDAAEAARYAGCRFCSAPTIVSAVDAEGEERSLLFGTGLEQGGVGPARLFCLRKRIPPAAAEKPTGRP